LFFISAIWNLAGFENTVLRESVYGSFERSIIVGYPPFFGRTACEEEGCKAWHIDWVYALVNLIVFYVISCVITHFLVELKKRKGVQNNL
jgi:hypothetical protein